MSYYQQNEHATFTYYTMPDRWKVEICPLNNVIKNYKIYKRVA